MNKVIRFTHAGFSFEFRSATMQMRMAGGYWKPVSAWSDETQYKAFAAQKMSEVLL